MTPGFDDENRVLENDPATGLDLLCRALGIPVLPRYSVLRVGLKDVEVDGLLRLLHYGIRIFLISTTRAETAMDPTELRAFEDSRLLEWAAVGEDFDDDGMWVVDGAPPQGLPNGPERLEQALAAADETGAINAGQYRIVHAPAETDLLVTAGAGTGKTETMSERLLYLLATSSGTQEEGAWISGSYDLRADEIVLMTFTREAARQMRERISRTLMLRRRLCCRCVLPVLEWLMQLSNAEIVTIHTYAKRLLQSGGGVIGLGPGLSVSHQTIEFRALLHKVLSPRLEKMFDEDHAKVPASYRWQKHIQAVWDALENNGVEMMPVSGYPGGLPAVDWGGSGSDGLRAAVEETTRRVVDEVAVQFHDLCLEKQAIPTSELVPLALAALQRQQKPRVKKPRYLFVDEFQDTDALQIGLVLEISTSLGAKLFVVGDPKQGIYRFRGAEGNAFEQLRSRAQKQRIAIMDKHSLSRNFRAGALLLDSLHPYFAAWGRENLLVYREPDRLRPQIRSTDTSKAIEFRKVSIEEFASCAAEDVQEWREEDRDATIAVLCRRNRDAVQVQAAIQASGGSCELMVGGSFFTSPAVRELHVLLQAVAQPSDDAALLQLCETRWAAGILRDSPPQWVSATAWGPHVPPPRSWQDRVRSMAVGGVYIRTDLEPLQDRLWSIKALLNRMPVMAWIVECAGEFRPEDSQLPSADYNPQPPSPDDDSQRRRYARCLDHLIMLMDAHFKDGPVTLQRILSWLSLQIATNHNEDEPVEWSDLKGTTTALTVHKAKGLEFDRVLVPNTWIPFHTSAHATRVSVLRDNSGRPRVAWQWTPPEGHIYTNVPVREQRLWLDEKRETTCEETRLLYVALTRAKDQLRIYLPETEIKSSGQPSSWAELMNRRE